MSSLHFKGEISYGSLKMCVCGSTLSHSSVGGWFPDPLRLQQEVATPQKWPALPPPPHTPPHTHTPRDIPGTPTVYQKSCHLPTGGTFQESLKDVAGRGGLEKQGKKPDSLTGQSSIEKGSRQGRKKCPDASSVFLSIPISRFKGFRFLESLAHTFTHLPSWLHPTGSS